MGVRLHNVGLAVDCMRVWHHTPHTNTNTHTHYHWLHTVSQYIHIIYTTIPTSSLWSLSINRFPLHFLHLSFSLMKSPEPPQSSHWDCICCTIPGPIWRYIVWIPDPLHFLHVVTEPDLPPELENKCMCVWVIWITCSYTIVHEGVWWMRLDRTHPVATISL